MAGVRQLSARTASAVAPGRAGEGMEARRAGGRGEAALTFADLSICLPELRAIYANIEGHAYG
jgi:hypothetical protein